MLYPPNFLLWESRGRALSETASLLLMQSDSDRGKTLQNFHDQWLSKNFYLRGWGEPKQVIRFWGKYKIFTWVMAADSGFLRGLWKRTEILYEF